MTVEKVFKPRNFNLFPEKISIRNKVLFEIWRSKKSNFSRHAAILDFVCNEMGVNTDSADAF